MARQVFIELSASPGSGVAAVEGLADLFERQFAAIEARAAKFASDINAKLAGIGAAAAQTRTPSSGGGSSGTTEVQQQREAALQATLRQGFALYEQQKQKVAQAAAAIRALGGDTAYTQNQIRNLERVVDSANGRLTTIKERLAAGAQATQAMAISANIAVNRFSQLDAAISQATERVKAQIAATNEGSTSWTRFQGSLGGVKEKLNDISGVLFGVGAALTGAGLAAIAAGKNFLESFGEVEASKKALESLGLSAAEVERQYAVLLELAKRPALDPKPLLQYSNQLQQLGVDFENATKVQAAFGNAIARTGGGAVQYQGAIEQVLQALRSGKLLSEDFKPLFRLIGDLGPALQNAFGTKDLEALRKKGLTAAQVIQGVANEFQKLPVVAGGTKNSLENLGIAFDQFKAKLGQALAPVVVPVLEKISDLLDSIGEKLATAFTSLPTVVQQGIVLLTGLATALGSALVGLAGIVKVGASVAAVFSEGGLLAGVGTFITGTLAPIAPILLAIAAAAAALYVAFQTNFLGIRDYVLDAATALRETFDGAITRIKADFAVLSAEVAPAIAKVFGVIQAALAPLIAYWKFVVDNLASVIRIAFIQVKAVFESIYVIVRDGISIIAKLINGDFAGAFKGVGNLLETLQGIFQTAWAAITRIVERAALNLLDKILGALSKIIEGAKVFLDRLGTFFTVTLPGYLFKAAGSALDFVKSFISNLYTGIVRVNEWINALLARLLSFGVRLFQAGIELGKSIWNGLISFLQDVAANGLTNVLLNAISKARAAIQGRLKGLQDDTAKVVAGEAPADNKPKLDTSGEIKLPGGSAAATPKGAKGKTAKSALTDSQEQQINALETQRTLANEQFEKQQFDLDRSLKLKKVSEEQYTKDVVALYEARLKRLAELSDREEAVIRSARGLNQNDRNERLNKIGEQRRKALEEARKAEIEANDKLDETERKTREDHLARLQKLQDDYDKIRIQQLKEQADRLLITNEDAENKIFQIESERLKAQRRAAADARDSLPETDTAGRQRAQDDLNNYEQQIEALRVAKDGRIKAARDRDLTERKSYNEAVKKSNLELLQSELAVAESTRQNGIIDVNERRANAQKIVALQKEIVEAQSALAQAQIQAETTILAERARLHGASQDEILRIQTEGNNRIIAEQQRLRNEVLGIDQQGLGATTEGTFLGGLVAAAQALGQGGILDAAIERVRRLGDEAVRLNLTWQGFKNLGTGALQAINNQLGTIVGNFILTGKTGTNVLGQLTKAGAQYIANYLKQRALEFLVKGLDEIATGISYASDPFLFPLAPGKFAAGAKHLALAGLAGAGAAVVGSLGGSGEKAAGATAGSVQASNDEQKKQTEYLREIAERQQKVEIALNIRTEEGILTDRAIRAYDQNGAFTNLLANAGDPIGSYGSSS